MSRTIPVTLVDFQLLVAEAQKTHHAKNEPIPALKDGQLAQIDSCLKTPFQTFGGKDLYRGFAEKAAILFYLINKNHALLNGNKRMACLCLGYFAHINKKELFIPDDDFYDIAKDVTESDLNRKDEVLKIVKKIITLYIGQ